MDVSARSNRSTEAAGDLVVAQINVRAARGADCRSGGATNLLFPSTLETLDDRAMPPFPKILKFAEDGGAWRCGCFFASPQLQAGFRRKRREIAPTLTTNRAFRRCVLHLLEATVWAFQTDFCRRRTGHRTLIPEFPSLSAPSERCLDWLAGPHNFRAGRGRLRGNRSAGDFRFTNKSCSLFNDKPRCFQISLQCAF
jgi:hypothetical protein